MRQLRWIVIAALLVTPGGCASAPPAYSPIAQKAFKADELVKAVQALSETAIKLNATTGKLHLSDKDTSFVRDFALSAGAGLVSYGQGTGTLGVVVTAFHELTQKLSANAALNEGLRFYLGVVTASIENIPAGAL